jgi:HEAT repeats
MSISRILLITLLISSGIVALALFNLDSGTPEGDATEEASSEARSKPKADSPQAPNLQGTPQANAPVLDTAAEDAEIEREQIAEAMKRLTSPTESERVEAVEQLGAYPNPQTEATLSQLLAGDSSADVRNAAALSLGSLEAPSPATVSTLLSGLKDQSEDVRFSSLSTLEDFMLSQEEESPLYQNIRTGLKDMAQSTGLPDDLRDSINEVLKDPNSQLAPGNEPAVR